MSPYFSIIIPTLNEEKYLPLLLSDLTNQKDLPAGRHGKNFEVIVVDGNSTDNTQKAAQKFSSKLSLQFFSVEKRNVSYQRNFGAQKAKAAYLVFIDADTRVPSNFIKELKNLCYKKKFQLVMPSILWDDNSQKAKILHSIVKSFIRASQYYGRPLSTGGNVAIQSQLFSRLLGFNEDLFMSEDHDLVRRAYELGIKAKISKNLKVTLSLRRGKVEGDGMLVYKHIVGFLLYTMFPSPQVLKRKIFDYEMGGHRYEIKAKSKELRAKKTRKMIDMEKLRQLLQLSAFIAMLRYMKMW